VKKLGFTPTSIGDENFLFVSSCTNKKYTGQNTYFPPPDDSPKRDPRWVWGFTLIETIVSISIFILLLVATMVILDPIHQLAKARNTQRQANLNVVMNAIGQNRADAKGMFSCAAGPIPTTTKLMAAGTNTAYYDIGSCLAPIYLTSLPFDPSSSSSFWVSATNYNTGYTISQNATTGRITVSAPAAELGSTISVTR